jgi:uncharacterized protein YdeI (YjbR/CyaY-like superfamily)
MMWRYAMTKKQKSAKQIKKTAPKDVALCHGRKNKSFTGAFPNKFDNK